MSTNNDLATALDTHSYDIVREQNDDGYQLIRKRRSWSLSGTDHELYRKYFLGKENGFFIEAGANDGLRQSNTMYFEFYKNWRGILIEPIDELMQSCKLNRSPNNMFSETVLIGPEFQDNPKAEMYYTPENNGLLSVLINEKTDELMKRVGNEMIEKKKVVAATLNEILDRCGQARYVPRQIDLMVLDIEGGELDALRGIDLDKHKIRYLLIEELNDGDEISNYLLPWYEKVEKFGEHDYLYRRMS